MKLAYGNYGMPQTPFKTMVSQIAQIGYDALEICVNPAYPTSPDRLSVTDRQSLKKLVVDQGMTIDKLMLTGIPLLEPNQQKRLAHLDQLRQVFELGADLELEPIIVSTTTGGRISDWEAQKELLITCLAAWIEVADAYGGIIAFEPHVNAIVHNPQRALSLLADPRLSRLKINFDYSHFELLDISLSESVVQLAPYIISTHVKDVAGRPPEFQFLLPGQGKVDYVEYLHEMAKIGFMGAITVEISAQVFRQADYDAQAAAQLSYNALSAAFAEAGIKRAV